jgi:hypothetical protein
MGGDPTRGAVPGGGDAPDVAATPSPGGVVTGGTSASGAPTGGSSTGGQGSTGGKASRAGGAGTGGSVEGGAGGTGGDTPVDAFLDLDRTRMDFGTIVLDTTATDTFTVTNRGASISGVPSIGVEAGVAPDPVLFTVTNVGDAAAGPIAASIVGEFGSDHAISDSDCTTLTPLEGRAPSRWCAPPMERCWRPPRRRPVDHRRPIPRCDPADPW